MGLMDRPPGILYSFHQHRCQCHHLHSHCHSQHDPGMIKKYQKHHLVCYRCCLLLDFAGSLPGTFKVAPPSNGSGLPHPHQPLLHRHGMKPRSAVTQAVGPVATAWPVLLGAASVVSLGAPTPQGWETSRSPTTSEPQQRVGC